MRSKLWELECNELIDCLLNGIDVHIGGSVCIEKASGAIRSGNLIVVAVCINYQRLKMSKGGLDDRLAVFNKLFPGGNVVGLGVREDKVTGSVVDLLLRLNVRVHRANLCLLCRRRFQLFA